jgi:sulfur-oxidizing protein SoxY
MKRRDFVTTTVTGAAALTFLNGQALAEWPKEIMETKDLAVALGADGKGEASDKIKLDAPEVAENGAVVPITIDASDLGDVESISLLIDSNPRLVAARFSLSDGASGKVSTRIKMGKSGNAIAVVKAGGKVYHAQKAVKVTIGGCGG